MGSSRRLQNAPRRGGFSHRRRPAGIRERRAADAAGELGDGDAALARAAGGHRGARRGTFRRRIHASRAPPRGPEPARRLRLAELPVSRERVRRERRRSRRRHGAHRGARLRGHHRAGGSVRASSQARRRH